jgi:hypothetical protein
MFSQFQWEKLKENSLVLAQTIQRVFEKKIYQLIRTTRDNILSLQLMSIGESSVEMALAIRRVAGIKFNELTAKTAVVLHKIELNRKDQKWVVVQRKSREVVQTVFAFAKGVAGNAKRVITEHEADVFDNIN